jgi:hypothetical protein
MRFWLRVDEVQDMKSWCGSFGAVSTRATLGREMPLSNTKSLSLFWLSLQETPNTVTCEKSILYEMADSLTRPASIVSGRDSGRELRKQKAIWRKSNYDLDQIRIFIIVKYHRRKLKYSRIMARENSSSFLSCAIGRIGNFRPFIASGRILGS